jgi:curved DNA-binding protein CbpA
MNLYAVLGISRDADGEDIRVAYHLLARRYHPDIRPGGSAEKFRQITEAYEVLRDPYRREAYDRSLAVPVRIRRTPPEPLRPTPTVLDVDWLFVELLRFFQG